MSMPSLQGWTPVWVRASPGEAFIDWCYFGANRCIDSFFEDTVSRVMANPASVLFRQRTPFAALESFAQESPGLKPSALIFHLSRSGSTLISQMLATSPANLAIAEAPPMDSVIIAAAHATGVDRATRVGWIQAMASALGQPRHGEKHFFLKLDNWHVLELPLIAEAFPNVPWIFLYREPLDVLLSQERQRGSQLIPGMMPPQVFSFDPPWTPEVSLSEYTAWVLARILRAAVKHVAVGRGRLVNYGELKASLPQLCSEFFGIEYSAEELARMAEAAQFHSKQPGGVLFVDETAQRRQQADPGLMALSERFLAEPYAQLETLRASQAPL
jgi:hypothetical protein